MTCSRGSDRGFTVSIDFRISLERLVSTQLVILARDEASGGGMAPIGSRADLVRELSLRNTSAERPGDDVLHGPGIEIQMAPEQDPITQMLLTINDEDIAWTVILRLAKELNWRIFDPRSGRSLEP